MELNGLARPAGGHAHDGRVSRAGFDVTVPNVARIYDYLLGGKNNFHADRVVAEQLVSLLPDVLNACQQNRQFLQRVVRYLVGQCGIRQIIDIGSGLPTAGNVHEVAQQAHPETRVVYADYDPLVVRHAEALLAGGGSRPNVAAVNADIRCPKDLLNHPELSGLIDFGSPVAVLMLAILHFVPDSEDPEGIVEELTGAIAPGSYIAISHMTDDEVDRTLSLEAQEAYLDASAPAIPRSNRDISKFFTSLDMVPPGLVDVNIWQQTD